MKHLKKKLNTLLKRAKPSGNKVKDAALSKISNVRQWFFSGTCEMKTKRRQKMLFCVVVLFIVCVVLILVLQETMTTAVTDEKPKVSSKSSVTKFDTGGTQMSAGDVFKHKIQKKQKELEQGQKELSQNLGIVHDALKKATDQTSNRRTSDLDALKRKVEYLEGEIAKSKLSSGGGLENKPIERISINLNSKSQDKIDTVDTAIPRGAIAKGVLLSGVSASTSLGASAEPEVTLIRITDAGNLPRRFKSDLKDCRVIGAAYGDLSSERVKIRLEGLTCIERATGEIVDTEVAGSIFGEDGISGLRGRVVERASGYLTNSVIGGVIGGLSNTFAPTERGMPYILQSGSIPKGPSVGEKFTKGFTGGMTSSMDRLSQYYIDRAESLSPVIEISPGRIVDIIFTNKAEIGSSQVKQELSRKRDAKRREIARSLAEKDNFKSFRR